MDRRGLEAMACRHHADGLWWMPPPPAAPPPVALRDSDQKRARHAPHTRPAQKVGTRVRDGTGAILVRKKAEKGRAPRVEVEDGKKRLRLPNGNGGGGLTSVCVVGAACNGVRCPTPRVNDEQKEPPLPRCC